MGVERRARARLAWFKRYEKIGNISQVCREFCLSRKTFYKWWPLYDKEELPGLKDRSKRPKSHPNSVLEENCPAHCEYDSTRLRLVWVYQELCPANSVDFAQRMLKFFPFPVEEVQTDHGIEFTYIFMPWVKKPHPFEEFLKEKGISHKLIPIATPKQNGKVERSHRTDDEEFYNQHGYRKPAKRRRELSRFLDFYNNQRPHSALGWMTPLEKLWSFPEYQGVTLSLGNVTYV